MAKRLDAGKLAVWRKRLAKFESSGLTVAAFCRQEDISSACFYYWSRRVRRANATGDSSECEATSASHDACSAPVEVFIGDQVRVSFPSASADMVASVLQGLQALSPQQGAFQRVVVNDALASRR